MIQSIALDRVTGDGKYIDVIDVCEILANGDYGSAANALAVMARQSPLFRQTLGQIRGDAASPAPPNGQAVGGGKLAPAGSKLDLKA